MPGIKKYNRDELLDRAIALFRRQGFSGTSTAELVADFGINRKSMYAEFGSKQELFEATLQRYSEKNLTRVLAVIESEDADDQSIRNAFASAAAASESRFNGLGCLMCNTAVERASHDPGSEKYVVAYLERLTRNFRRALFNSRKGRGGTEPDDLDALAAFFTLSYVGISALVRAKAPAKQVKAASEVAMKILEPAA